MCHGLCQCVTVCVNVSLSVSMCHCLCQCVTVCVNVSLSVSMCHCLCQCVTACVNVSLSVSMCHCLCQSITVHNYVCVSVRDIASLSTVRVNSSLSMSMFHYKARRHYLPSKLSLPFLGLSALYLPPPEPARWPGIAKPQYRHHVLIWPLTMHAAGTPVEGGFNCK